MWLNKQQNTLDKSRERNDARCVLCGKSRQQVRKLIVGMHGGVCLECVGLCSEIIRSDAGQEDVTLDPPSDGQKDAHGKDWDGPQ